MNENDREAAQCKLPSDWDEFLKRQSARAAQSDVVMVKKKEMQRWYELRDACIEVDAYYRVSDGTSNEADRFKRALEAIKAAEGE